MGASVRVEEATVENWQQVLQEIKDDCDADLKKIQTILRLILKNRTFMIPIKSCHFNL